MLSSRTEENLRDEERVGGNEHAGEKEHADTNQHGSGADPSAEQSQSSDALTQALTDMYKAVENMSSEGPGCEKDSLLSVVAVIDPLVKAVRKKVDFNEVIAEVVKNSLMSAASSKRINKEPYRVDSATTRRSQT